MYKHYEIMIYIKTCGLTNVLARGDFFGTKTRAFEIMKQEKQNYQKVNNLTVRGKVVLVND